MERQDIDKMYLGKSEAKPSTSNDVDVMKNSASPSTSLLSIFHEDVLLSILSFVADAPFEVRGGDDGELWFLGVDLMTPCCWMVHEP